jgi:hypothetical protein
MQQERRKRAQREKENAPNKEKRKQDKHVGAYIGLKPDPYLPLPPDTTRQKIFTSQFPAFT